MDQSQHQSHHQQYQQQQQTEEEDLWTLHNEEKENVVRRVTLRVARMLKLDYLADALYSSLYQVAITDNSIVWNVIELLMEKLDRRNRRIRQLEEENRLLLERAAQAEAQLIAVRARHMHHRSRSKSHHTRVASNDGVYGDEFGADMIDTAILQSRSADQYASHLDNAIMHRALGNIRSMPLDREQKYHHHPARGTVGGGVPEPLMLPQNRRETAYQPQPLQMQPVQQQQQYYVSNSPRSATSSNGSNMSYLMGDEYPSPLSAASSSSSPRHHRAGFMPSSHPQQPLASPRSSSRGTSSAQQSPLPRTRSKLRESFGDFNLPPPTSQS